MSKINHICVDRFLEYIRYDTQSNPDSSTCPSTEKQKLLAKKLADDLKEIGLPDANLNDKGYVYATLPSNVKHAVPTIGLIAHMDTSPDVSGQNVKHIIHEHYKGGDIILGNSGIVIKADENAALGEQIGHDIITSDGTTLLGADNKAGIAEIFDALSFFVNNPEIKHGRIKVAITPDEEIGQGADHFDVEQFAADYAYTIDGETVGEIEDETFCADAVTITFNGINVHPGYAKNKMVNSIKIAAFYIEQLPKDRLSPETTEKREGYVHPHFFNGNEEQTVVKFLIRDFTVDGLKDKEKFLKELAEKIIANFPGASFDFEIKEYYRNMKYQLDKEPKVVDYAIEAVKRAGIEPKRNIIRGGTDGARLSYMGLLTPNIFTGGHNFHSRQEWISIQDMKKAVQVIIKLVQIWEEKSR